MANTTPKSFMMPMVLRGSKVGRALCLVTASRISCSIMPWPESVFSTCPTRLLRLSICASWCATMSALGAMASSFRISADALTCDLTRRPAGVIRYPFGEFDLTIEHALLVRYRFCRDAQLHVLAGPGERTDERQNLNHAMILFGLTPLTRLSLRDGGREK